MTFGKIARPGRRGQDVVRESVEQILGGQVVDKSVHDLQEQAERDVRARLGPDRWARAYAVGRSSSIDSLIQEIDAIL